MSTSSDTFGALDWKSDNLKPSFKFSSNWTKFYSNQSETGETTSSNFLITRRKSLTESYIHFCRLVYCWSHSLCH